MLINIAGIIEESIVDGPGFRYVVFFQGCPHKCFNCHNPETHEFSVKNQISVDEIIMNMTSNPFIRGITISGGEPFAQVGALKELVLRVNELNSYDIFVYSGYTIEELFEKKSEDINIILSEIDYLVDGKYIDSLRDLTLLFKGSKNQRIIDMKKTIKNQKVTEINNFNN